MKAIEIAIKYSRPLIKTKWDRVKDGEPAFKYTRNSAIIEILILFSAFIVLLLMACSNRPRKVRTLN